MANTDLQNIMSFCEESKNGMFSTPNSIDALITANPDAVIVIAQTVNLIFEVVKQKALDEIRKHPPIGINS